MWDNKQSLTYSVLLHFGLLLLAIFGLPAIFPNQPDPEPMVMTVEILPIAPITNVKPSMKPITPEPKKSAPTPKPPKPMPPKAEEKPKPKAEPEPEEEKFEPLKDEEEKPKEEKKDADKEFEDILKNLKETPEAEPEKEAKDKESQEENKTKSELPYDESMPLSLSEKDFIRNQFTPCWSPPAGAKATSNLVVVLKAQYEMDGTLIDVKLRDDLQGRYTSDSFFRSAADSALRAVHRCSPLKQLPADKYGSWRDMELTFDPKDYL